MKQKNLKGLTIRTLSHTLEMKVQTPKDGYPQVMEQKQDSFQKMVILNIDFRVRFTKLVK